MIGNYSQYCNSAENINPILSFIGTWWKWIYKWHCHSRLASPGEALARSGSGIYIIKVYGSRDEPGMTKRYIVTISRRIIIRKKISLESRKWLRFLFLKFQLSWKEFVKNISSGRREYRNSRHLHVFSIVYYSSFPFWETSYDTCYIRIPGVSLDHETSSVYFFHQK